MLDPIKPNALSEAFGTQAKRCGLAATFHVLRHTHCSHLLRSGVAVHVVSKRLGHADAAITLKTYAHLIGGEDASAAGIADQIVRSK
jgi:integrase